MLDFVLDFIDFGGHLGHETVGSVVRDLHEPDLVTLQYVVSVEPTALVLSYFDVANDCSIRWLELGRAGVEDLDCEIAMGHAHFGVVDVVSARVENGYHHVEV